MLTPEFVVKRTVQAILTNQQVLMLPGTVYFLVLLKASLPSRAFVWGHKGIGATKTMKNFVGRQPQQSPQQQSILTTGYETKQGGLPTHSIGITIEPNKQMGTEVV